MTPWSVTPMAWSITCCPCFKGPLSALRRAALSAQ
jgi:hypothetical protein